MSIVIDNKELERLLQRVAATRGCTVEEALRVSLEREISGAETGVTETLPTLRPLPEAAQQEMLFRLQQIAARSGPLLQGFRVQDVDGLLYDERGLPK